MIYSRRNFDSSCISPTEHDIFSMIDDNSFKTRVIVSKLASFDRIRSSLRAEQENMCVSLRNIDLYSKKRRISCILPTELDILVMIDDKSLKTRVIASKLAPIDKIRWILKAEHKNMYVSLRNNDLFSKKRRFSCISPMEHDILGMIDDNSLKTRLTHSKLVSIDRIRWSLQAENKNMCVSMRNNDLFSKKRRFSRISQTDHDILCMIDDTALEARVIPSKLVSIDCFRWTLPAEYKNMCVSLKNNYLYSKKRRISPVEHYNFGMIDDNSLKTRVFASKLASFDRIRLSLRAEQKNISASLLNNDLFSKKRRFSRISPTEHDILGMMDYKSLKNRVNPSKLFSIYNIRLTLLAEHKNMCVSLRNNHLFSKKRRFSCFRQRNTIYWVWLMITLWKFVLFLQN